MVFDNITIQSGFTITMVVWSGGPLTPGSAITRPTENICGNSTCLKTPQYHSKEGRLKPFFANNVDIPFAKARRLKPCPRKATGRSGKTNTYFTVISTSRIKSNKRHKMALHYHSAVNVDCLACNVIGVF